VLDWSVLYPSPEKRLIKELLYYEEERSTRKAKLEEMRVQGADESDTRHAQNMLTESESMVPSASERLETSEEKLSQLLAHTDGDEHSNEIRAEAHKIIDESKTVLARANSGS